MHLKSLTLKGFKSFASATTLRFEPGITCVVGPNGSGKSNVVDAIAWVLGEQGAKSLRGGKMEDVIFAGTTGRSPLGRAEVTLTIDNSDGAIPIDYSEVAITRRMFRSGEAEYEINGDRARLLDIQDLLSDAGIGKEMHVLVGQGKLDSYLHARPEDRRSFIEEAAGVLKHRKRKEKALRKLNGMQGNLDRLNDLTDELRRQLKPLGRQARLAQRAQTIQADLRDARLRLLATDLAELRSSLRHDQESEEAAAERKAVLEGETDNLHQEITRHEQQHRDDKPRLEKLQETWYNLQSVAERLRSTKQLAKERARYLSSEELQRSGPDPREIEAEAESITETEIELRETIAEDSERLDVAREARSEIEARLAETEQAIVEATRAATRHREALTALRGQVESTQSTVTAADDESERALTALQEAQERAEETRQEFAELEGSSEPEADAEGESELESRLEELNDRLQELDEQREAQTERLHQYQKESSAASARAEALSLGLQRKDGNSRLLADLGERDDVLGSLAALTTVTAGYETAVASALGQWADAVAMTEQEGAMAAIRHLHEVDGGRAQLVLANVDGDVDPATPPELLPAASLVETPPEYTAMVRRLLRDYVVVDGLDEAAEVVNRHPGLTAVTVDGDVLSGYTLGGGSDRQESLIEIQSEVDQANRQHRSAQESITRLESELEAVQRDIDDSAAVRSQLQNELKQRQETRRKLETEAARFRAQAETAAKAADAEVGRLQRAATAAAQSRDDAREKLTRFEAELEQAEQQEAPEIPDTSERDELNRQLEAARQNEMEIRLAVRTAEERATALSGRADTLRRQAAGEREERERAQARAARRAHAAAVATAVADATDTALERLQTSLEEAASQRDRLAETQTRREAELTELRQKATTLQAELERLTEATHREQLARAQQKTRIEALETKAVEEFGIDLETLLTDYGPDNDLPPTADEVTKAEQKGQSEPESIPFDRAVVEKRVAKGERELKSLGKVNPLALEEFAALEERYKFLNEQLEDVKRTRGELLGVVDEVDKRIEDVFIEAYNDTAREFAHVFQTVFPGGDGRLVLTDPDNLLNTGVEVEARPPGKKVKRLSLLSGGERSLTALALLCAIFRARPSPFYLMDEVEAALDDVNLGRLLELFKQLRETSQLLIITHQKRTMEIADALYGVTMRSGVTQIISQKFDREE
ncbi:chromosome segregation protein SMC [Haloglycomyces albus]|uniref:chromosome segregation protein SMC n=1 Tax=Haloglycomyces albus TaxID=526067 RepID=UPI00046D0362|nr:chromosome segregation protein SMC [Haloglycomyces albus]